MIGPGEVRMTVEVYSLSLVLSQGYCSYMTEPLALRDNEPSRFSKGIPWSSLNSPHTAAGALETRKASGNPR